MSYDLDLSPTPCDHLQIGERCGVDQYDFRTLYVLSDPTRRMRAPVNGEATVRLRINDRVIPQDHPIFGWRILEDFYSPEEDYLMKQIQFNHPVKLQNILIEVEYVTIKSFCRKCHGRSKMTDLKVTNSHAVRHQTGAKKLQQRVMKYVLTTRCPTYPSLAGGLRNYIGRKFGVTVTEENINQDIVSVLERLKQVQALQSKFQYCAPEELLRDISNLSIVRSSEDPGYISISLGILSFSNEVTTSQFGLKVR